LIEAQSVWFSYAGGPTVIRGVSLSVSPSELVYIEGPNASGKTTLLKLLAGVYKPLRGRVLVDGLDTRKTPPHILARHVVMVFQDPGTQLVGRTLEEEAVFGVTIIGLDEGSVRKRFVKYLRTFGVLHPLSTPPRRLSLGEQRLVVLAACLARQPRFILLDEPFFGLDAETLTSVVQVLSSQGYGIVIASCHYPPFSPNKHLHLTDGKLQ